MTNNRAIKPLTPKQQRRCNVKGCAANGRHDLAIDEHVDPHLPPDDYALAMRRYLDAIERAYDASHSTTGARMQRVAEIVRGLSRRDRTYVCKAACARLAALEQNR
jgi:hypothetical protein